MATITELNQFCNKLLQKNQRTEEEQSLIESLRELGCYPPYSLGEFITEINVNISGEPLPEDLTNKTLKQRYLKIHSDKTDKPELFTNLQPKIRLLTSVVSLFNSTLTKPKVTEPKENAKLSWKTINRLFNGMRKKNIPPQEKKEEKKNIFNSARIPKIDFNQVRATLFAKFEPELEQKLAIIFSDKVIQCKLPPSFDDLSFENIGTLLNDLAFYDSSGNKYFDEINDEMLEINIFIGTINRVLLRPSQVLSETLNAFKSQGLGMSTINQIVKELTIEELIHLKKIYEYSPLYSTSVISCQDEIDKKIKNELTKKINSALYWNFYLPDFEIPASEKDLYDFFLDKLLFGNLCSEILNFSIKHQIISFFKEFARSIPKLEEVFTTRVIFTLKLEQKILLNYLSTLIFLINKCEPIQNQIPIFTISQNLSIEKANEIVKEYLSQLTYQQLEIFSRYVSSINSNNLTNKVIRLIDDEKNRLIAFEKNSFILKLENEIPEIFQKSTIKSKTESSPFEVIKKNLFTLDSFDIKKIKLLLNQHSTTMRWQNECIHLLSIREDEIIKQQSSFNLKKEYILKKYPIEAIDSFIKKVSEYDSKRNSSPINLKNEILNLLIYATIKGINHKVFMDSHQVPLLLRDIMSLLNCGEKISKLTKLIHPNEIEELVKKSTINYIALSKNIFLYSGQSKLSSLKGLTTKLNKALLINDEHSCQVEFIQLCNQAASRRDLLFYGKPSMQTHSMQSLIKSVSGLNTKQLKKLGLNTNVNHTFRINLERDIAQQINKLLNGKTSSTMKNTYCR